MKESVYKIYHTVHIEKGSKPNIRPNIQHSYERLMETADRVMKRETHGAGISDNQICNCLSLCYNAPAYFNGQRRCSAGFNGLCLPKVYQKSL